MPRGPGTTDPGLSGRARVHPISQTLVSRSTSVPPRTSTVFYRPLPSSLLKLRPPDREPHGQRPGLNGVLHVGQLFADDPSRVLRHRPTQNPVVDSGDELLYVRRAGRD